MEKVKIIFANGEEIEVEKNGSCYITDSKPELPEDLSVVTIQGEDEQVIENARLIECASVDGRYWFSFIEISADELWKADIEDALCDLSRE